MSENADKAPAAAPDHISLHITGPDGNDIHFKVRSTTPFRKLFSTYADKVGKRADQLRFYFDGTRLGPDQTPADFDMEDGDQINTTVEQTGGHQ